MNLCVGNSNDRPGREMSLNKGFSFSFFSFSFSRDQIRAEAHAREEAMLERANRSRAGQRMESNRSQRRAQKKEGRKRVIY